LVKKLAQGRDVDSWDIAFAAMDGLAVVAIVGATGKLATQTLKAGTKQIGTTVAKRGGKKATGASIDWFKKLATQGRMMTATTKQYFQPLIAASAKVSRATDRIVQVDITGPLRWIFQKTGVGRDTIKRLTGLEARVFMRNDARVLIRPSNSKAGVYLKETADSASYDLAGQAQQAADQYWQQHASAWWLENAIDAH
jgi:hypothetical protein